MQVGYGPLHGLATLRARMSERDRVFATRALPGAAAIDRIVGKGCVRASIFRGAPSPSEQNERPECR